MDYILKKFGASINMTKHRDITRINFLRARIEYVFYLLLGFTWNKYKDQTDLSKMLSFAEELNKDLMLGKIIGYILAFDKSGEVIKTDTSVIMKEYNELRIRDLAHGYIINNPIDEENKLNDIYKRLCECTPLLAREANIIVVTNKIEDKWEGYCLSKSQFPKIWNCSADVLRSCTLPCVMYQFNESEAYEYFQLSPFIHIEKDAGTNVSFFTFFGIENKGVGNKKVTYTNLFDDNKIQIESPHLKNPLKDEEYRRISNTGTVMNPFEPNYKKYIDVGVRKTVDNFVKKNKANVTAVLSGNGGVGKTSCAQKICMDLFDDRNSPFKYIIFASAKDRRFNVKTGKIEEISAGLKNYYGVIETIYRTIKNKEPDFLDEESEAFNNFVDSFREWSGEGKILLVVDDFETFNDEEKEKIAEFLRGLDTHKHKVLVTTRNRALIDGQKIQTDSLDEEATVDFIKAKLEDMYPAQSGYFNELITKRENIDRIHTITEGVPVFIIQWIHLFAQKHEDALGESNLSSREEARRFLVERVYNYFNQDAKILYAALYKISEKGSNLLFDKDTLKSICEKSIGFNTFETALDELEKMNVVQKYGNSENTYLIYNDSYLSDMKERFFALKEQTRDSISNKLDQNYGGRIFSQPYDSLLAEARLAFNQGSNSKAESTYRQVIKNTDFPREKRVEALIGMITMMTTIDRYEDAIKAFNTYKEFSDHPKLVETYIWALWGCTSDTQKRDCQKTVFEFLEKYFCDHKDVNSENLSTYAMGATFYSRYVSDHNIGSKHDAFEWCYNVYQYAHSLSDEEFTRQILEVRSVKQNTSTALIQGINISKKLCYEDGYKEKLGEIANFYLGRYPQNLTATNRMSILNTLKKLGVEKDDYSDRLFKFVYSESFINMKNNNILGFFGKVDFNGAPAKVLLHIKECAPRFVKPDEMLAFEKYLKDGNTIDVKIKRTSGGLSASLIGVSPSFDHFISSLAKK